MKTVVVRLSIACALRNYRLRFAAGNRGCIDSRSEAGCLSRNSAVDDSIGESYGVTDFSVQ